MPRRSRSGDAAGYLLQLRELLSNFERELQCDDLRKKVLALVPVNRALRDLGGSLVPKELADSGMDRILHYFQKYPQTIISGEEVSVVAGIDDWARRVRQLRVEMGWGIISGQTARAMVAEKDLPESLNGQNLAKMKIDDYLLISPEQDRDAAHRWNLANSIRRKKVAVKDKILLFLRTNVAIPVTGEELRYVASGRLEWARRARELRTEDGWPVVTKSTGMPELPVGVYLLEADRQNPPHDRKIPDNVRLAVLERDKYTCTRCGWDRSRWSREVPRNLELHHVRPHAQAGENSEDNLTTLCNVCHDDAHVK